MKVLIYKSKNYDNSIAFGIKTIRDDGISWDWISIDWQVLKQLLGPETFKKFVEGADTEIEVTGIQID